MGGMFSFIEAPTKSEVMKISLRWLRDAKAQGLEDIRLGYDPKKVVRTETGYGIQLWAHT